MTPEAQPLPKKRDLLKIVLIIMTIALVVVIVIIGIQYNTLQTRYNDLNGSYELQAINYGVLNSSYFSLNTTYNIVNSQYYNLLIKYNLLSFNYNITAGKYITLSGNYTTLQAEYNASQNTLSTDQKIINLQEVATWANATVYVPTSGQALFGHDNASYAGFVTVNITALVLFSSPYNSTINVAYIDTTSHVNFNQTYTLEESGVVSIPVLPSDHIEISVGFENPPPGVITIPEEIVITYVY